MIRHLPHSAARARSGIALVILSAGVAGAQPVFEVYPGLPGGPASIPFGISANGAVVVGLAYNAQGWARAVRWNDTSTIEDLGTIQGHPGGAAQAASADGSHVVGASMELETAVAMRWSAGKGMTGLGTLPGRSQSVAQAISGDGSVIAGYAYNTGTDSLGFRWSQATDLTELSPLAGDNRSMGIGISADGEVIVGFSMSPTGVERAVRWVGGVAQPLGVLPDVTGCRAWAASADGGVVVGHCNAAASGNERPFRWTVAGGMQPIEIVPGFVGAQARGVSADGSAIAGILRGNDITAFYWTEAAGMQPIADLLGPALPPGYIIGTGLGISGDGKSVVMLCGAPGVPGLACVARFGPEPCYANCDGSAVEPVLNIDDFTCFINEFAAGLAVPHEQQVLHYANCDGSTTPPALNIDDFTCFINAFAAGCP